MGDEAIDALDGLDPSIRRGRNTAIRGGRGRKARKTAAPDRTEAKVARKSKLSASRPIVEDEMDVDTDVVEEPLPLPPADNGDDSDDVFEDEGEEEADGDEEEEVEDEDVDLGEGRIKRTIRRPARYTR